ncbi:YetF domain-containing protein [Propionispora hippei]|uniref:Uncharacterized membrane protein YcaP, DUF421 family n=1 Tax=Propionispora hippei DSM 15287 TaxID=1123003 RepID=A0A1M6KRI5_9FIRM|nr:DUF421 domain-containing protein [Propionispora hippei]SHJ61573.1 Uncharacterized membrane protein YcaP, DUF421 family [Propionispora hippei DSM 15287]
MLDGLDLIIRTLLILGALLLIARILGRRTLSELTFYDFVIGLIIGNIGSAVITETDFGIIHGLVSLVTATLWLLLIDMLSMKFVAARKLIEAEPLMVMHKGKILDANLKKRYYNTNDLLEMLREQGIFDPDQVELALIEPDGELSILKKTEYEPPAAKDFDAFQQTTTPASQLASREIIIDGKIIEQGLAQSGLTREELTAQLNNKGITNVADVTVAMLTPEGELYVDRRKDT